MAFFLNNDIDEDSRDDPNVYRERFASYQQYLQSIKQKLPLSAYEFAVAEWHYDPQVPQCPHDAWLELLTISEPSTGTRHEKRSIEISMRLLGAYHDGHIEITYKRVQMYSLITPAEFRGPPFMVGHGDWLTDEVRLSVGGLVIHEIDFSRGSRWLIESADIAYEWKPFPSPPAKDIR